MVFLFSRVLDAAETAAELACYLSSSIRAYQRTVRWAHPGCRASLR
jgi:hypothetical protein